MTPDSPRICAKCGQEITGGFVVSKHGSYFHARGQCPKRKARRTMKPEDKQPPLAPAAGSAAPTEALLIAGQLAGISTLLDADTLERWLDTNPKGFNYEKWCRAAITFKRVIVPPNEKLTDAGPKDEPKT